MALVRTLNDIIKNLTTLEGYITGSDKKNAEWAANMVANGENLVIYKVDGVNHFAPSRFCAFPNNTREKDAALKDYDSKTADKAVGKVVGKDAFANKTIDTKYTDYCKSIGVKPSKTERIFWRLYEGGSYLEL